MNTFKRTLTRPKPCCICDKEIPEGNWIVLCFCSHSYCRGCLKRIVENQIFDFEVVKCAYILQIGEKPTLDYKITRCGGILTEDEIREVACPFSYEHFTGIKNYLAREPHAGCNVQGFKVSGRSKLCLCSAKRRHSTSNEDQESKKPKKNENNDTEVDYDDPEANRSPLWEALFGAKKNSSNPSDENGIRTTGEEFECIICLDNVSAGDGVMLDGCSHSFHRKCLASTIEHSESIQIKCPHIKGADACQSLILDREIKAVVSLEVFEKYLKKSIDAAELGCKNRFHCLTKDCTGWCEAEGALEFLCPVCNNTNCIKCKAIHENISCVEHKFKVNFNNNKDEEKSKAAIEGLIQKKEAKPCPNCAVVIIKNGGCNQMKCEMCKNGFKWDPAASNIYEDYPPEINDDFDFSHLYPHNRNRK